MCYDAEFGRSTPKGVNIEGTQKLGSAGAPPHGMGGVTDPKKHAPPSRYLAECDRSMLKDVGINRGEPPNWGLLGLRPLGTGTWLTS